jgi:hypothetical protein
MGHSMDGGGNARKKMRLEVLIPGFNEEESSLVGGFLFSGKY